MFFSITLAYGSVFGHSPADLVKVSTPLGTVKQVDIDGICKADHVAIVKIIDVVSELSVDTTYNIPRMHSTLYLEIERDIKDSLPTLGTLKVPGGKAGGYTVKADFGTPQPIKGARYLLAISNSSTPVMWPVLDKIYNTVLKLDSSIPLPSETDLQSWFNSNSGSYCE